MTIQCAICGLETYRHDYRPYSVGYLPPNESVLNSAQRDTRQDSTPDFQRCVLDFFYHMVPNMHSEIPNKKCKMGIIVKSQLVPYVKYLA